MSIKMTIIKKKVVIKIKFNIRLKELRLANGETQKELAKSIEVGRTTISEYESGKIVPKQERLLKLADHFNVSVDYLTGVSDEPTSNKTNDYNLSKMLNTIQYILLGNDAPVKFKNVTLSSEEKIIVCNYIDQVKENVDIILKLRGV